MKRKPTLAALRRKLDKCFSVWIRTRDCTDQGGFAGHGACVTCGRFVRFTEGHAGHFIPRQHTATRYDERNVHLQDAYCNTYRHGALIEYTLFMQKTYGQSVVDELMRLKRTTKKYTREELESLIEKYTP